MPRSVMGELVPTLVLPVLRLEAQKSGAVEVERFACHGRDHASSSRR